MGVDLKLLRRAVFLDRDGVLNRAFVKEGRPHPPASLAEFEILPGVPEACALLQEAGFLLVVVTNQPDVGRGTQRQETVEEMHDILQRQLPIDRIEVCYDSGRGLPSIFRKPAPGMLFRAAKDLGLQLATSFMVGDRSVDIACGRAAGCHTILIDYGYPEGMSEVPEARVCNLQEAARLIVKWQ